MTYEDFKRSALTPPRRDEATVFEVMMLEIAPLPEHRRNHYPKIPVIKCRIGFSLSLSGAGQTRVMTRLSAAKNIRII